MVIGFMVRGLFSFSLFLESETCLFWFYGQRFVFILLVLRVRDLSVLLVLIAEAPLSE